MYYLSTRDPHLHYTPAQAIAQGLSREGGLFVPAELPVLAHDAWKTLMSMSYAQRAAYVMGLYLDDFTAEELAVYATKAYSSMTFDTPEIAPVHTLDHSTACLELWHGPTCAFKDMALQMLPHLLSASLQKNQESRTACILAATSGDTGKGALEGFKDVPQTKILTFYPQNGVSEVQELQMRTQEGENVGVCAVVGNFDDAQSGVKHLFSDPALRNTLNERGYFFSSANSINWGRVLPQIVYYVSAYAELVQQGTISLGDRIHVCVPTGNFGNILAAYYAKQMGVPIDKLICASNRNHVLTDFLTTGIYDRNRPFYHTESPSMDILISSNLERLLFALTGGDTVLVSSYMDQLADTGRYEANELLKKKLSACFAAGYADEDATRATIGRYWKDHHHLLDPHTAVAVHVREQYREATGDDTLTLVVSTASPFKFSDTVLRSIEVSDLPDGLAQLDRLHEVTQIPTPAPLERLKEKPCRFSLCVEKEQLSDVVLDFLN